MTSVIVIGNVNVDLVMGPQAPWPVPGTEVVLPMSDLRVGGAAGNTALALQALGVPFHLVASTGDDALGRWLAEPFGEGARAWPVAATSTGLSVGITHPDGERTFFTTLGHLSTFDLADVLAQLPGTAHPGATALLTGSFVLPALLPAYGRLIAELRGRGFAVALDTGWPDGGWSPAARRTVREWLPDCRHLLINEAEAFGLCDETSMEAAARALLANLPDDGVLVIKRGPDGAEAWSGDAHVHVRAPPVTVVDTIGAGDCFNAGYLAALADGRPLAEATGFGVTVASIAVSTRPRRFSP